MTREIKLPELGEGLEGGDIIDVKVTSGATVSKGQTLLELEAEKSTVEVPSPSDGRITEVMVKKGDHLNVGQTICLMEEGAAAESAPAPAAPQPEGKEKLTQAKAEAKAPSPKESQKSAEKAAPPTAKPELKEKPTPAKPDAKAPASKEPPKTAEKTAPPAEDGEHPEPVPAVPAEAPAEKLVPAGPATRRLARELGVDLGQVAGNATDGRVTQEDVKSFVRQAAPGRTAGPGSAAPLPDFERWGPVERKPLDGIRRKTAEQMSRAWNLVPQVTHQDLADVTDLEAFRKEQTGPDVKLTMSAFALKATAIALKSFPEVNASLDTAAGQIVLKRYYHIGMAVATDRGLLVPVLRDVDRKSVAELARELAEVADRARQKKLTSEEMRGGTFTITNLGGIGGSAFSPIVNYPEAAILGLARARLQPWVHAGQIVPRLILPLCLSYDHRLIDGALVARFTRFLAEMLERPLLMLLEA